MLKVSVFNLLLCNARYFGKVQPAPFFFKNFFPFFYGSGQRRQFWLRAALVYRTKEGKSYSINHKVKHWVKNRRQLNLYQNKRGAFKIK